MICGVFIPLSLAISIYGRSRSVSTCALIVRVGNIQASEATTKAIVCTLTMPLIEDATTINTNKPGTVSMMSATLRMTVSTIPPTYPAINPSTVPIAKTNRAGQQPNLHG